MRIYKDFITFRRTCWRKVKPFVTAQGGTLSTLSVHKHSSRSSSAYVIYFTSYTNLISDPSILSVESDPLFNGKMYMSSNCTLNF